MKKARFLSLLLAAVMTASAMPVFATTASAAENLITSGTLTASGATSTLDASEDGYISVGGRTNRENSLQYQYNFKYGTRYRVSFAGRQSVPSNQNYSFRVKTATQGSIEFQSWKKQSYAEAAVGKDILVPNGHHWLSGESISNKNIAVNDKWKADYPTGSTKPAEAVFNTYKLVSDNIAQGTMSKDCAWGNYSFTYQFIDNA